MADLTAFAKPSRLKKSGGLFFGWWIVFGSLLSHAIRESAFFFVFGVYLLQWQQSFGWSKFAISSSFSFAQLVNGGLSPIQGWLIDRFGARVLMNCGTLIFGFSLMGLSTIQNLHSLFIFVVLISIGANMAGFLTTNAVLANWFLRKRAFAMGVASSGMGVGGAIAPSVAWAVVTFGWRETSFWSGIALLAIGLPIAQLFRHRPEDFGLQPDNYKITVDNSSLLDNPNNEFSGPYFTISEALRDRSFWFISIGHCMALLVVVTLLVHLVPHLVKDLNWSETSAQSVFTLITATSVIGQIVGGILGDRYSKSKIAGWCMLGHFGAMVLFAFAQTGLLIVVAAVLQGMSWGMRGPLMMAIRADYYGRKYFATITGISTVIVMIGPLIGPAFAGAMYDFLGEYTRAFGILGVLTGLGSAFFFGARKPAFPSRLES
jgi:MFS family permease